MHPTRRTARIAGSLYLLMGLPAVFSLLYIPSALIVPGDPRATANKILASETLFRLGIVSELVFATVFIFVVRALYRLLSEVNRIQASLMMILALVSIPIWFVNVLNEIAALTLMRGAGFLSGFEKGQLDALAMLFLDLHRDGFALAHIFSGLWLFPFGVLVMQSGFIPRVLGLLLMVAGLGYLAISLASLLLPAYASVVSRVATLLTAGEFPIMPWLLIKGVTDRSLVVADS